MSTRRTLPGIHLGTLLDQDGIEGGSFVLPPWLAQNHWHVIGTSGKGKSYMLASLFVQFLASGGSATLIDPAGDLSSLVIEQLALHGFFKYPQNWKRLLYLNVPYAEKHGCFLPCNFLSHWGDDYKRAARLMLLVIKRAFPDIAEGAPRVENNVLHATAVLAYHKLPFALLPKLLFDKAWRQPLVAAVPDRGIQEFFAYRFDRPSSDSIATLESTLNRYNLLNFSESIGLALSQKESLLDYRRILDEGRSVIINLALGDDDATKLFGCLLSMSAEQGARARSAIAASERHGNHWLIMDEYSEFAASSAQTLTKVLDTTRKYGLFSVLSHQTYGQVDQRLSSALQNCGVDIVFGIGADDAEVTAHKFGHYDPHAVKYVTHDPTRPEPPTPQFYTPTEQQEIAKEYIADLRRREAVVQLADGAQYLIRSLGVPNTRLDPKVREQIELYYLNTLFVPKATILDELQEALGQLPSKQDNTPTPLLPFVQPQPPIPTTPTTEHLVEQPEEQENELKEGLNYDEFLD